MASPPLPRTRERAFLFPLSRSGSIHHRLISASYEMADPPCLFRNVNYHSGDGIDTPKQSHHSLEPVPIRSEPLPAGGSRRHNTLDYDAVEWY
jgi:hypothetical protein